MKQLADLMGKPALDDMPLERPSAREEVVEICPVRRGLATHQRLCGYWWETCDRLHVTNLR
jgi:hypothetical protein